jgi:hypothetical protein
MDNMTWEQKLMALKAISRHDISLCMREPGNWYLGYAGIERVEGSMLVSGTNASKSPEEAVNWYWEFATNPRFHMRIGEGSYVKWNGFMWEKVTRS